MSKTNKKKSETKEIIKTSENKKSDFKVKTMDKILKWLPILISVIALAMTFANFQYTKNNYFYNRVFQPLTYHYDFDIDNENFQKFGQHNIPLIKCKINTNSGYINKILVVTTDDNKVDTVYDYNSKAQNPGLLNDMGIDFDLTFSSIVEYEGYIYQYIFIYVESANSEWNLDCIKIRYNENYSIEAFEILDTPDLIRKSKENDEIDSLILSDYEMVYNEMKSFSK